jgi:hypothetical protein
MPLVAALLGVIVGVLLGGAVQLFVSWRERKARSRRAARLLFGDCQLAIYALNLLILERRIGWGDKNAPPLDGWRQYRESLADAMEGAAFQTVDGAFYRIAQLETVREADIDQTDIEMDAEDALKQMEEARTLLLLEGFSGRELARMQEEMEQEGEGQP